MISLLEYIVYLNTFINIYRIKTYPHEDALNYKQTKCHIDCRLTMINSTNSENNL